MIKPQDVVYVVVPPVAFTARVLCVDYHLRKCEVMSLYNVVGKTDNRFPQCMVLTVPLSCVTKSDRHIVKMGYKPKNGLSPLWLIAICGVVLLPCLLGRSTPASDALSRTSLTVQNTASRDQAQRVLYAHSIIKSPTLWQACSDLYFESGLTDGDLIDDLNHNRQRFAKITRIQP